MTEIEQRAQALYEESRKKVSGRPSWANLDPDCPYDMGMRETALRLAQDAKSIAERLKPGWTAIDPIVPPHDPAKADFTMPDREVVFRNMGPDFIEPVTMQSGDITIVVGVNTATGIIEWEQG